MPVRLFMKVPLVLLVAAGCDKKPERLEATVFDAREVATRALELYDGNDDGHIDASEASPALAQVMDRTDRNKDGRLSEDELAARLAVHLDNRIARQTVGFLLERQGAPVEGATVRLIPDPCFGDLLPQAEGVSDMVGFADVTVPGSDPPGVPPGWYRVEVSLKVEGTETLPARFHRDSEIGVEVGAADSALRTIEL